MKIKLSLLLFLMSLTTLSACSALEGSILDARETIHEHKEQLEDVVNEQVEDLKDMKKSFDTSIESVKETKEMLDKKLETLQDIGKNLEELAE